MAIDEDLRRQVRQHLSEMSDIEEKPMVGGTGFMWRGNLLCGIMADSLLIHIAQADFKALVAEPGARAMVMGGRTARRWILVDKSIVSDTPAMRTWIDRAAAFVGTLPAR
jgi:TfoX/Sxy family transcriptional regulator of competence genes